MHGATMKIVNMNVVHCNSIIITSLFLVRESAEAMKHNTAQQQRNNVL